VADITVIVTSPGYPTTWGNNSWGNNSWGEVSGALLNSGSAQIQIDTTQVLSTNLLNTTTGIALAGASAEVFASTNLITSTINTVYAAALITANTTGILINSTTGTFSITANANLTPNTNILNIVLGDESITGDSNLTLSTNLLNTTLGVVSSIIDVAVDVTAPGSPTTWGEYTWGQQAWGTIIGLEIDQGGEEVVVPSVEVNIIGIQLNTTVGVYSITGDANLNLSTNLLTISLGDEDAIPNTIVNLSTNLLNISLNDVYAATTTFAFPTGVQMTVNTGRLFISAWAVIDTGVTNTWTVVDIAA
jgi:hypothetical protein